MNQRKMSEPHVFLTKSSSPIGFRKKRSSVGNISPLAKTTIINSPIDSPRSEGERDEDNFCRLQSFIDALSPSFINKRHLQKLSWKGIAWQLRHKVWKVLLGQLPLDQNKQASTLQSMRENYKTTRERMLKEIYNYEQSHLVQIRKDLVRPNKDISFLLNSTIQKMMENVLMVWALRHPACGYVQGMSDIVVPLVYVYLTEYTYDEALTDDRIQRIPETILLWCEADIYYGFDMLMMRIQDHYTLDQQGIMEKLKRMEVLVSNFAPDLYQHLKSAGVIFIQFAFRWINCCLLREFSLKSAVRLWDSYISVEDGNGFGELNLYCCVSLLTYFKSDLMKMDFSEMLQFLQHLPTENWGDEEIQALVSQAFVYQNSQTQITE
ncbi:hypothetical protein EIN_173180 [Entamoeba invadens IP1]|uniref:Rab-GAP TBC domain-containing protein n=1 Tax=Entamoeba invadens IP1 TaxID=370355 RepID=A0A0A1U169_ENTIV|nr:hypothetical protein EIN_173180 [Entamoeba invadens IP1]ELP84653.1 hypothetical protein EIN_173180 [Entamoeba invadens IP1]|eukprot:XP_004183999.1 hypothetical protein EIN_173180 [Entamoeba invadens IP1]